MLESLFEVIFYFCHISQCQKMLMHFEYLPHLQQKKQELGMCLVRHLCQLSTAPGGEKWGGWRKLRCIIDLTIWRREEDSSDESEQGEMDEDEEEEIPLDMEVDTLYIGFNNCNSSTRWEDWLILPYFKDVEAVSKKARQDDDLGTEHLQVT